MRKLLIVITFIIALSACAYKAEIDSRSTMASCVDKGLDESALIECSSTYAEERLAFCENKAKEKFGFLSRTSNYIFVGPFRRENHADAIFIQRCLKNSGVEVHNAAY